MELELHIKMNENLYLRDPQETDLGKTILRHSADLIHEMGFENFTFKKLAEAAGTTEASVYRYFENKHKLLVYLTAWYWNWLRYRINFVINNITEPEEKLKRIIQLLASPVNDDNAITYINESKLHQIVVEQGLKAYLTKQVTEDNKQQLFKPYKDLCSHIGGIILECNADYKYPRSLASTLVEMAHLQTFFKDNLPSLTDFGGSQTEEQVILFLNDMANHCILKKPVVTDQ
jgi:hypothetical protein